MIKAKDIMQTDVRTVKEDMKVDELGRIFVDRSVSGLPVVDDDGSLVGMVTENDLISQNKSLHIPTVFRLFDAIIPLEVPGVLEKEIKKITGTTVGDICTRKPIVLTEESTLEEIATIMSEKQAHHLPVLKDGELVGMVDQHDVIKGLAG